MKIQVLRRDGNPALLDLDGPLVPHEASATMSHLTDANGVDHYFNLDGTYDGWGTALATHEDWHDISTAPSPSSGSEDMRTTKRANSTPITRDTAERLYDALEAKFPGKVWRCIEVCPVAVVKTIDNEADAFETLRRLGART